DASNVESADRVLTAQIELLEDRQRRRAVRRDVVELPTHTQRCPGRLLEEPDAFKTRLDVFRVAAQARNVERHREPPTGVREDRIVHCVVDEARRDLAHTTL